jgi:hypothetical protein
LGSGSLLVVATTPSTPHGDPVSLRPEDEKVTKRWNTYTYAISLRANPPTGPTFSKNEDSASVGIAQELQKTNDYSTDLHGNLNNFSSCTEILASKVLYKALRRLRQLTIPYGKRLRN